MYDYAAKVKEYFENYYNEIPKAISINVIYNTAIKTVSYPISDAPIIKFDDFIATVLYTPIELDNIDSFQISNFYTQHNDTINKTYLTFLSALVDSFPSLKTLLSLSKFTLERGLTK